MARILMVNHALGMGGSPISLLELALGLRQQGHTVIVASEKGGVMQDQYANAGIPVHILPRAGLFEIGLIRSFLRLMRQERIEVLHLNTFTSYFKYPALAGRLAGIPVVWWTREDVLAKRCQKLVPWMRRLATRVVTVSREQADHLARRIDPERITVCYKGLHPEGAPWECGDAPLPDMSAWGRPVIGVIASLEPRKGVLDLVEAAVLLAGQGVDFSVVVAGEDPSGDQSYMARIRQRLAESGLAQRFHFLGNQLNARALYSHFDVFVLPTHWDCCARVLLEAMEAGCPIVTTDAGGTPEMLQDGVDALLVPVSDPPALAAALAKALADPAAARRRAESARQVFASRFLFSHHLQQVDELYRGLAGQGA